MLRNLEFTIPIIKSEFKKIKRYIDSLAQIRSGFFCTICDADFQNHLDFIWEDSGTDLKFSLGNKFCNKFVDSAIPFVRYMFNKLKIYIDSSVKLIQCEKESKVENPGVELEYMLNPDHVKTFNKCDNSIKNGFQIGCDDFCANFDLTSINPMVDGDVQQLRDFVLFFKENSNIFSHPQNNFLVNNSIRDTETLIDIKFCIVP